MRAVGFLLWGIAVGVFVWRFLRGRRLWPPVSERGPRDELVKDPVCQTYVVRSRAVSRTEGGQLRYFCSPACARRYLAR